MLHLRSQVLHGMIGGLAAGVVVALWFLAVDIATTEPLHTPVLLARTILRVDEMDGLTVLATPPLALGYTVLHFSVFALLGAAMATFLGLIGAAPGVLLGGVFALVVLDTVYYVVLLITGSNVLQVLPAIHVLGANLLGGVVLMAYLHRASRSSTDFGPQMLKHHKVLTEGLITGLYGALAVAIWFLLFDSLTRQPFYTPAALGSFLFLGASSPPEVRLQFGVVAAYTVVHLTAFSLMGVLFAWSAERLQRVPAWWLIWLLAFIVVEGVFLGTIGVSADWVLSAVGLWSLVVGNLIGVAAMLWRVRITHPALGRRLKETVDVRV
jgi:hypothetical protein